MRWLDAQSEMSALYVAFGSEVAGARSRDRARAGARWGALLLGAPADQRRDDPRRLPRPRGRAQRGARALSHRGGLVMLRLRLQGRCHSTASDGRGRDGVRAQRQGVAGEALWDTAKQEQEQCVDELLHFFYNGMIVLIQTLTLEKATTKGLYFLEGYTNTGIRH
jgi:hypothetical protein